MYTRTILPTGSVLSDLVEGEESDDNFSRADLLFGLSNVKMKKKKKKRLWPKKNRCDTR